MNSQAPRVRIGALVGVYLVLLVVALAFVATHRGPWLDEYWTLWLTDRTLTAGELWERWSIDVHPPLYVALVHAAAAWAPLSVDQGRLLNFVPLAGLLTAAAFIAREPAMRRFTVLFLLGVTSSVMFVTYFAELRSYFLGMCAFAVVMLCLRRLSEPVPGAGFGWGVWTVFFVALVLCLNVHFITALITALIVGVFGLRFLLAGRTGDFLRIALMGIAACVPMLGFFIRNHEVIQANAGTWITTSTPKAAAFIIFVVGLAALGQIVVLLLAGNELLRQWREGRLAATVRSGRIDAALLTSLGIALAAIVLLAYHARHAIVQDRYVLTLGVAALAVVANLGELAAFDRRWVRGAVMATSVLLLIGAAGVRASEPRWYGPAARVKELLAACPTSRVVARELNPSPVYGEDRVRVLAHAMMARDVSLPLADLETKPIESPPGQCPDIVWIPHTDTGPIPAGAEGQAAYFTSWNPDYAGARISMEIFGRNAAVVVARRAGLGVSPP